MQAPAAVTTTQTVVCQPPVVLRLHNRAIDAAAIPVFENHSNNRLIRAKKCLLAFKNILEIQKQYDARVSLTWTPSLWKDPLSLSIFDWIDELSDFVENSLIPASKASSEQLDTALDESEKRVTQLFTEILVNPFDRSQVLDNPLIEGGLYVWGESLLNRCKAISITSPYTLTELEPVPHVVARQVLAWGNAFFNMTFSIDETPLDSLHYQIIQECAATIVAKFHARAKRLETLQKLQQWPQKLQSLQQGNLQELIRLMQSQAEQLRAQNSEGCQRLLDLLNATKGSLNETIQELKTLLEAEEKRSFGQMKEIAELKVAMSLLESRLSAAEHRNAMNEQMLRCAQESLANQDSGGDCVIM